MNEQPVSLAQRSFLPLLALGILDRLYLLLVFGFKYVGDDDGVIWTAAVDYGHGLFREPYFYGQDYAFMLEALVAAPFTHLGMPFYILMPTVTSLLALSPFWSFAFWHRKHQRPVAALVFLAMPVLLPLEYGMMTTITRCFISGIAPLAFLPWITDMRSDKARLLLFGLVGSAAAFINPNSLIFSLAFVVWSVMNASNKKQAVAWTWLGMLPFTAAYLAAQSYCRTHPERMVHVVNDWRMTFHPGELIPESLGMLNLHFAWLFPLLPTMGGLAFALLIALSAWNFRRGDGSRGLALSAAVVMIIVSFAFPKTHDGTDSVFYSYSRMYLALPLLLCWGSGPLIMSLRAANWSTLILLCGSVLAVVIKLDRTAEFVKMPIASEVPVLELPVELLIADAANLRLLKEQYHVDLIVGNSQWDDNIKARFRGYIDPILEPALTPLYVQGDRRYWQRGTYAPMIAPTLLVMGGDSARWASWSAREEYILDVSDERFGPLHVIRGNTERTDSLLERFSRMPGHE